MPRRPSAALLVLVLAAAAHAEPAPRYDAVLARVSGSMDGRPLAVTRENVEALARDLTARGLFRQVHGPEQAPGPDDVRLELEEHYTTGPEPGPLSLPPILFGERVEVHGTLTLRARLPGEAEDRVYEAAFQAARTRRSAGHGETREQLIAEVQAANLEQVAAQLRAEQRLFELGP
jgi:hypothetical protein